MRCWLIPLAIAGCKNDGPRPTLPTDPSSTVASPAGASPVPASPNPDANPPPPTAAPDDHRASATAIYDATNYVAPAQLAYSRKLRSVIYPACHGGEGPGESCSLAGFDSAGASFDVERDLQVTWRRYPGDNKDRQAVIDRLVATFDKLDTLRLDRSPWRGDPAELPGYGTLVFHAKDKQLVATRDGRTTKVAVPWEREGPVNVFGAPSVPLAVVQSRFNPASGGRESAPVTEGYVVFVQLVVVPRP